MTTCNIEVHRTDDLLAWSASRPGVGSQLMAAVAEYRAAPGSALMESFAGEYARGRSRFYVATCGKDPRFAGVLCSTQARRLPDEPGDGGREGGRVHAVVYVSSVIVAAPFRRQGVCKRLISALVRHLKDEQQGASAYLYVAAANEAAIRCYASAGFKAAGVAKQTGNVVMVLRGRGDAAAVASPMAKCVPAAVHLLGRIAASDAKVEDGGRAWRQLPATMPVGMDGRMPVIVGTADAAVRSISDLYQYHVRSHCRRSSPGSLSLTEFIGAKRSLLKSVLQRDGRPVTPCNLLLAANMAAWGVCDTFDVTVAVRLLRWFNARRVLDFCAGWGDRLVAAIAVGAAYTGVDLNGELFPGYARLVEDLVPAPKRDAYRMVHGPAEAVDIPRDGGPYDTIFTSPPYFASERYAALTANRNPYNRSSDVDAWLQGFLFQALRRAWSRLAPGGHMLIALDDGYDAAGKPVQYLERLGIYVKTALRGSSYRGCIGFRYPQRKSINPVWVWQKQQQQPPHRRAADLEPSSAGARFF